MYLVNLIKYCLFTQILGSTGPIQQTRPADSENLPTYPRIRNEGPMVHEYTEILPSYPGPRNEASTPRHPSSNLSEQSETLPSYPGLPNEVSTPGHPVISQLDDTETLPSCLRYPRATDPGCLPRHPGSLNPATEDWPVPSVHTENNQETLLSYPRGTSQEHSANDPRFNRGPPPPYPGPPALPPPPAYDDVVKT